MKIGIIGLGLIGGSIYKALIKKHTVIGISSSVKDDNISTDYNTLKNCDIIFVCTPMSATIEILNKLETIIPPTTIVTDVCSVKKFVTKQKYSYKFIPSHPMAGTENQGWDYSFPELFNNANWVITPINETFIQEQKILEQIIKELGAEVIITTPEEHDKAVALISHFPLLVAQALCLNIENNKLAQKLASSGFRDTTRLALSNTTMAEDMLNINRDNIVDVLDQTKDSLNTLLTNNYRKQADSIKEFRRGLF